jgi:hypothetical protein
MAPDEMEIVRCEPRTIEQTNRRLEVRRNLRSNDQAFFDSADLKKETRA